MLAKIYAKYFIWYYNLTLIRKDRGAIEYAVVTKLAKKLWGNKYKALSIGEYILWGSKELCLNDIKTFRHEMVHIKQYKKYGVLIFKALYLLELIKSGYDKNKFEVEANKAEEKL